MIEFVHGEQATVILDFGSDAEGREAVQADIDSYIQKFNGDNHWSAAGDNAIVAEIVQLSGPAGGNPEVRFTGGLERIAALFADFYESVVV